MKTMIKFIAITVALVSIIAPAIDRESNTAAKIISMLQDHQVKFCQKGFKTKNIRSFDGKYCRDKTGAALGELVCKNFKDYNGSDCHKNAQKIHKNPIEFYNDLKETIKDDYTRSELCLLIEKILPEQAFKCDEIIKEYAAPPKPNDAPPLPE